MRSRSQEIGGNKDGCYSDNKDCKAQGQRKMVKTKTVVMATTMMVVMGTVRRMVVVTLWQ